MDIEVSLAQDFEEQGWSVEEVATKSIKVWVAHLEDFRVSSFSAVEDMVKDKEALHLKCITFYLAC